MKAAGTRLRPLLLAVGLGVAVLACGRERPVAATVNGEPIRAAVVDRELADIVGNEPYVEARRREGVVFRGTKPGTYDAFAAVGAGEDFAEVAKRQSTDVDSASRGGALGSQTMDGLARLGGAFRDVAVTLAAGQVSVPSEGSFGTFLVQVTDVKVLPFEEVRGPVRAQVLEPAQDAYEQLLRRLRFDAQVTVSGRYGTWDRSDPDAIAIIPPGARPTTTVAPTTAPVGP